jgi:hypothetical protein
LGTELLAQARSKPIAFHASALLNMFV